MDPDRPDIPRPAGVPEDHVALVFEANQNHDGMRLDVFLTTRIRRLSRSRAQEILRGCAFTEDGKPLKPNHRVKLGERVILFRPSLPEPEVPREFGVLYEDEWMMAVDKPAGLPVHPSARYFVNTLTTLLRERYGDDRPALVHRLDRETSGVLILAKTKDAERRLKGLFADRRVEKRYLAVTVGRPDPAEGVIRIPLALTHGSSVHIKMGPSEAETEGTRSETEYCTRWTGSVEVEDGSIPIALVEARPRTGRQHQVRVHLSLIGCPVLGDKIYGPDEKVFLEFLDGGMSPALLRRLVMPRHALHAWKVALDHPFTGRRLEVESPLPEDMARFVSGSGHREDLEDNEG